MIVLINRIGLDKRYFYKPNCPVTCKHLEMSSRIYLSLAVSDFQRPCSVPFLKD